MATETTSCEDTICKQCKQSIEASTIGLVCEGFCSNAFHPNCANLTVDDVLCYRKLANVYWMCPECVKAMHDLRKDHAPQRNCSDISSIPSSPKCDAGRYDKEISELKQQIIAIHRTLADISTSCSTSPKIHSATGNLPLAQSSPLPASKLLCGSRNADDSCSSDHPAVGFEGKYWLFFTRIKNTTTESEICQMVADSLGTNETTVIVKKLVPAWKDTSSLPYVSFKVGINVCFKESAMRQSTWPSGICFREFRNHLWEPTPRRSSVY